MTPFVVIHLSKHHHHHRHTSLEHTLIDTIIASQSIKFKGTSFSSLSHLVDVFREINGYVKNKYLINRKGIDLEIFNMLKRNTFDVCP
jgi:hypothetical protein